MKSGLQHHFFAAEDLAALTKLVTIDVDTAWPTFTGAAESELAEVEILITSWGAPGITVDILDRMPKLRAIVHAAGTVKGFVARETWGRDILVSTAASANAEPVAEFSLAMILLAGKNVPWISRDYVHRQAPIDREAEYSDIGNFGTTVGIIGASRIGSRVIELLRPYDLEVLVHDPYLAKDRARDLGVRAVTLLELAERSDIVSIHAPSIPETDRMVSAEFLAALRPGATLINTARAALVDQDALLEHLSAGRIYAILDVTEPEVLPAGHPLYTLPNVFLTPHLAGSAGNELFRLGRSAVAEVARVVAGEPLAYPVSLAELDRSA